MEALQPADEAPVDDQTIETQKLDSPNDKISQDAGDFLSLLPQNDYNQKEAPLLRRRSERIYNPKKPKWWKSLTTKPSKRQKAAMEVSKEYFVERPPYGNMLDLSVSFPQPHLPILFEIGFGLGDNLMGLRDQGSYNLLGAEIHLAGVGHLCQRVQERPVQHETLRIYKGCASKLLAFIPDRSVSVVTVPFPDPFPNSVQYRIFNVDILREFHRIASDRVLLATDNQGFYEWSVLQMESLSSLFQRVDAPPRSQWLPVESKYERKGYVEGRSLHLAAWKPL